MRRSSTKGENRDYMCTEKTSEQLDLLLGGRSGLRPALMLLNLKCQLLHDLHSRLTLIFLPTSLLLLEVQFPPCMHLKYYLCWMSLQGGSDWHVSSSSYWCSKRPNPEAPADAAPDMSPCFTPSKKCRRWQSTPLLTVLLPYVVPLNKSRRAKCAGMSCTSCFV